MAPQLIVILIIEALDGCVLYGPVHPFHLAIGPGMPGFHGSMLDVILSTGELEGVSAEDFSVCHRLADLRHCRSTSAGRSELDAVVGQHRVDRVGHGLDQMAVEVARNARRGLLV